MSLHAKQEMSLKLSSSLQSQNTLRVTHIIVPKQKGNADSCETVNEEELFDVQDQYDLITLGWIHVSLWVCLCVCVCVCVSDTSVIIPCCVNVS